MNKTKSNISLSNLSEVRPVGALLALRKGINEVFNKDSNRAPIRLRMLPTRKYLRKLSVIVCTSSRGELAANAIKSVLEQGFPSEKLEVLVVNNSNQAFKKGLFSQGVRIINEPTLGLSRARNRGAKAAKGEYLLFIDDDAYAQSDLLSSIYNAFEAHPKAAIIGGQIHLKLPDPTPEVFLEGKEALWSGYMVSYNKYKDVNEHYEFPYGACFAIRHSVLDTIGGFPLDYGRTGNDFAGGEETALCFAVKKLGLKIGIEPRAQVLHLVSSDRFTTDHVKKTIRAGILTTHRLFLDGYSQNGWNSSYISERIKIILSEIKKLSKDGNSLAVFYKQCELDAFTELRELYFQNN